MDVTKLKVGQTEVIGAKSPFDAAEKSANSGHYLKRLLGLTEAFKLKDSMELVRAVHNYVQHSPKPLWIDGLVHDVSEDIVYHAEKLNPTPKDWAKIVWGLNWDVLKAHDLVKYRSQDASGQQREDH